MGETLVQLDRNRSSIRLPKKRRRNTDPPQSSFDQLSVKCTLVLTLSRLSIACLQVRNHSACPGTTYLTGGQMFQGADDLLAYVEDEDVEFIDVRFCDLPGTMQHFTVPVGTFGPDYFEDGVHFDGSSIRGFQKSHESVMALLPDPPTA